MMTVKKLTEPQKLLLERAVTRVRTLGENPDRVYAWGLAGKSIEALKALGMIERRRLVTEDKYASLIVERDEKIDIARATLADNDWRGALSYLAVANRLNGEAEETAWFVTEKGKEAIKA